MCLASFTKQNVFKLHPCCCVISTSSLFMAEIYSTVWKYLILFFHSSADGYLGCFHFWAIMNTAAVNICFRFLGYIPRSRIAGSYGNSMFNFLRTCQIVFQSGCTVLYSHQQCMTVPIWKINFIFQNLFLYKPSAFFKKMSLGITQHCKSTLLQFWGKQTLFFTMHCVF